MTTTTRTTTTRTTTGPTTTGPVTHDSGATVPAPRPAVLDDAHVGDIKGAFGTIRLDDAAPARGSPPG